MADSTSHLPQMAAAADNREIVFNGLEDSGSPADLYGRNYLTCTGLVFGYLGGRFISTLIANGTVTATASNTNYVVFHRTTGAVSISTASTNWNDTATYGRMYQLVAGGSTITSYEDHRQAIGITPGSGGSPLTQEDVEDIVGNMVAAGAGITATYGDATGTLVLRAIEHIQFACSDLATALTTGTSKAVFRMPRALTVTAVRASLATAQASGSIFTVDINEAGSTILSTKLTIDNTEKTSTTAATPAVVSDAALADDAEITVDIDQVGDGTAKGLVVTIIGF